MKKIVSMIFSISLAFLCVFSLNNVAFSAESTSNDEVMVVNAKSDFKTVYKNVVDFIKGKNLTIFAEFDHAANAEKVDMQLRPTTVIVFGNPSVGTKLMLESQSVGLELPLKVLLIENADGTTQIVYQKLSKLFAPLGLSGENQIVKNMENLLSGLAKAAVQ